MKNEDNGLNPQRQPGPLVDLLGAQVSQWYAIDKQIPVTVDGDSATATYWAETITPKAADVKVIATYGPSNGWLDGQPAAVTRQVGKGSITYVGTWLDDAALAKVTSDLLSAAGVKQMLPGVPEGVEVCVRTAKSGDHSVVILINHNTHSASLQVPPGMTNLLDAGAGRSVELPAYGVAVFSTSARM
jgi:beta-galactosidase